MHKSIPNGTRPAGVTMRVIHGGRMRQRPREGSDTLEFPLGTEDAPGGRNPALSPQSRPRHLYISGQPGTGKSTLLRNLVQHDINVGTGCCLIDPHGGLVDDILSTARPTRDQARRIIVVDVADVVRPIGIDLIAARTEREQDLAIQFFLGLFKHLYLAEHQGPIFDQALRNGLSLLMHSGGTLAEFYLIFTDRAYLKSRLDRCHDPFVRRYFDKVWNAMTNSQRTESLAYVTSKFSMFHDDRLMRGILAQRGGLDFDACIADGFVVLVSLARGHVGDSNAALLGHILLHLVRRSAMRRDPAGELCPFHLYVDEAHELSGPELSELLTATRKFGIGITLANQSSDDFHLRVRNSLFGSVATFVALRQGLRSSFEMEPMTLPRFDQRDLARLPDHTAIAWSSVEPSLAQPLRVRLNPSPRWRDPRTHHLLRRASALRFGRPRADVEASLLAATDPADD